MRNEFRIIFTATFDSAIERDKAYNNLKTVVADTVSKVATYRRADMTKDDYLVNEPATERVI
jgi:hypothetical protein